MKTPYGVATNVASTRGSGALRCFGGVTSLLHRIKHGIIIYFGLHSQNSALRYCQTYQTHGGEPISMGHCSHGGKFVIVCRQRGPHHELVASVYIQRSPRKVLPSPRPPYSNSALSCQASPIAPRRAGQGANALAGRICCHVQCLVSSTQRSSSALRSGLGSPDDVIHLTTDTQVRCEAGTWDFRSIELLDLVAVESSIFGQSAARR